MINNSTTELTYKASSNHLYSEIGDEAVILDLNSGAYYGLNDVGVDLWRWLQQPQSKENLLNLVLNEYEVSSEQASKDIQHIIEDMVNSGLIEIVD